MRLGLHAVTGAAVMGALLPWTPAGWVGMALGVLGSQLPDWIELRLLPLLTLGRVRVAFTNTVRERGVWYVRHRGIFHDLGLYAVLWVALFIVDFVSPWRVAVLGVPVWLSMLPLGAIWHVVCDMGSMTGVPVLGYRLALRWYWVGGWSEVWAAVNVCGLCALVYFLRTQWGELVGFLGGVFSADGVWLVVGSLVAVAAGGWVAWRRIGLRRRSRSTAVVGGPADRISMEELTRHYRRGPGRRPEEIEAAEVPEGSDAVLDDVAWGHGELVAFWRDVSGGLEVGVRGVLVKILDILDAHGDERSVHGEDRGRGGTHDVLSRVSLVDHSVHVARAGLRLLQRQYPDTYRRHVPGVLYSCLLHDIGKVDALMGRSEGEVYNRGDHALDGATYVLDFLAGLGVDDALRKDVVDAVREHHSGRKEDDLPFLAAIVVKADREARREEYESLVAAQEATSAPAEKESMERVSVVSPARAEMAARPEEKELEKEKEPEKDREGVMHGEEREGVSHPATAAASIMDRIAAHVSHDNVSRSTRSKVEAVELPEGFGGAALEALRDVVNAPKEQSRTQLNEWRSISQPDGYVYMKLDFIGEVLREVAVMRGEKSYVLVSEDEEHMRGRILGWCDWLRDRGWLHPLIRPGFFSQRFKVRDRSTRREFVVSLVAVKIDAFGLRVADVEDERRRYPRLRELVVLGVASAGQEQEGVND